MTVEITKGGECDIYENATRFELVSDPAGEDKKTIEVSSPGNEFSWELAGIESFKVY